MKVFLMKLTELNHVKLWMNFLIILEKINLDYNILKEDKEKLLSSETMEF